MNPFKALYRIVKSDVQTVITTFKRMKNDEPLFNPERVKEFKAEMKGVTMGSYFKENWIWILTIIFAGVCGWVLSAAYYQTYINNYIVDNCNLNVLRNVVNVTLTNTSNVIGWS